MQSIEGREIFPYKGHRCFINLSSQAGAWWYHISINKDGTEVEKYHSQEHRQFFPSQNTALEAAKKRCMEWIDTSTENVKEQ